MNHRSPPPIAAWIFEHLRPSGCDEALAGDLLEEFRSGTFTNVKDGSFWVEVTGNIASQLTTKATGVKVM